MWLVVALRLALPADLSLPGAPLQMPAPAAVSAIYEQSEAARPAAEADEGAARGQAAARADREGIGAPALRALGQALPGLWAAGALAFLAWNGAAYGVFCAQLRRSRRPVTDAALLAAARRAFGRDVPVYECGEAAGPMLAGLVRPALYLPGDLPAADRPYVLAHEARHLQAWDVPYQFLLLGMQTVQWFNPAAHLLARRARADLELACDEAVLAGRDEAYRRAYGGAVLDSLRARRRACLLGTGFAGGKKTLKERILQMKFGRVVRRLAIFSVCAVLLGGILSVVLLQPQISQITSAAQQEEQIDAFRGEWSPDWEGWDDAHGITEPALPVKAALLALGAVFCALAAAWWLLVPAWLFQASVRARMNTLVWPLLGLLWSLWGLILFLVIRSLLRQRCAACGTWQRKASFCTACGRSFHVTCPSCGADCSPDDRHCGRCGASLQPAAEAASGREDR